MNGRSRVTLALFVLASVGAATSCRREERRFDEPVPLRARSEKARPLPAGHAPEKFLENAWSVSEGQRLFTWFNCAGCHSAGGGGGMGPPLRDATWLYGGAPEDVHRSIVEGRPNGMPAFGTRIPDYQVWQLTTYVLSLSGRLRQDVEPSRAEAIPMGEPPVMTEEKSPRRSGAGRTP